MFQNHHPGTQNQNFSLSLADITVEVAVVQYQKPKQLQVRKKNRLLRNFPHFPKNCATSSGKQETGERGKEVMKCHKQMTTRKNVIHFVKLELTRHFVAVLCRF
ncbi:hypothetical protein NPIL_396191 [Nephila pilipes]|uniref:Uncharacterized protein n=1 Tax=Nephila pilipes TaxID=299642 RepID=A0A8X6JRL8_NEPPI|nr:hypothetical protein NPIL_396191 [Nephila pilipes]